MATAASSPLSRSLTPSNPLPLSAAQEGQVRDLYYARVRGLCAEEIRREWGGFNDRWSALTTKVFAECARNRTISATWVCRPERLVMNSCMVANANQDNNDAAREEWFRRRLEKKRLMKESDATK